MPADSMIQAFLAGRQMRTQREDRERQVANETEDRSIRKMMHDLEIRKLKIDEAVQKRELSKQNFDLTQGQPFADLPKDFEMTGMVGSGLNAVPEVKATPRPMTIAGVPELGVPDAQRTPQSMEQIIQRQHAAKLDEPFTLNPGDVRIAGGEQIAANTNPSPNKAQPSMDQQLLDAETRGDQETAKRIRRVMNARDATPNATLQAIRELQLAQLRQAATTGGLSPALFNQAKAMADDYTRDAKDFMARRSALQTVYAAKDNAPGDMSLIFSFMKMLDPGSVVREGEYATAQNAAGVPDQIRNLFNRVRDGRRLNPAQREQFTAQAEDLYQGAKQANGDVITGYSQRAQAQGIDPKYVVFNLPDPSPVRSTASGAVPAEVATALKGAGAGRHTLSDGSVWITDASGAISRGN